jgi:tetratricopeptide (TPR) repeat protein
LELFITVNDRLSVADAYRVKGMVYRSLKHFDRAEAYLESSLRINVAMKNLLNAGETYMEMGVLAMDQGVLDQARTALQKARVCFAKVGAQMALARTDELIGQLKS